MTVADEIRDIKADQIAEMVNSDLIIIERKGPRFVVHQWHDEGISPQSTYVTAPDAVARVAQLMGVKDAVVPQHWPETACIGFVEK